MALTILELERTGWVERAQGAIWPRYGHYRGDVGYNPYREMVKHRGDLAIVVIAIVVVALLVAWALFGG